MLIGLTQQYDKLVFVGLTESNTFPRGGRCPEGADEERRNLKYSASVGITVQHLDEFRKIGTIR